MIRPYLPAIVPAAVLASAVAAGAQSLLAMPPSWHWQNDHLEELALRHPVLALQQMALPLRRVTGTAALSGLRGQGGAEEFWRRWCKAAAVNDTTTGPVMIAGLDFAGRSQTLPPDLASERNFIAAHSRLGVRSYLVISPAPALTLVNVMRVDLGVSDEPEYLGKRWRDITGLTEQAYVRFERGKYAVKLGRDYVKWGRGFDASLLLSDYSRALDQLHLQFDLVRLRLVYLAAQLDPWLTPDSLAQALRSGFASRYLAAGRLEAEILPQRLRLAFSQMVLSGGPHRRFEWLMLNPLLLYHGEQLNGDLNANTAVAFDALFLPRAGLEIYGQWLIDDFQIENVDSTDLEPNEWGLLVGGRVADPLGLRGVTLGVEFTRVANRTYKTKRDWEKFLHRQQPLAHFLGNDFERWLAHASAYAGRQVWTQLLLEYRRRGEGRITTPFDQPWLAVPTGQSYHEKFPSGIVARSLHLRWQARWHPTANFVVSLLAAFSHFHNYNHQPDLRHDEKRFVVGCAWRRMITRAR
ncbi:MAG: capsule assembly Wzi family protein [candidate division KSB1 bacterium]|nr:capsule assembly Wzi family protein [candidate division KSB1 bacterium]MDZ7276085.1 capsule assembly Wzi family protein [candidate division KSB1 bacterium]MDZ7287135.1 capsule assembly Wzi family protein [candidate division KSB1 bacterium]MDZ7296940.1 capsule assembly Wzi family protein [candidate division KSB1 bacterium]MDZ7307169.1 capsule assembly Wzi family protein [candidate division KSB1 bacterium]